MYLVGEVSVGDVSCRGSVRRGNVRRGSVWTPLEELFKELHPEFTLQFHVGKISQFLQKTAKINPREI